MSPMTSEAFFTGDETISDIMLQLPEAADILMSHNLSCVGCHINVYETLRQGMKMHNMGEDHLRLILADLNEAANDNGLQTMGDGVVPLKITSEAVVAIKEFQDDAGIHGWGISILAPDDGGFEIDFAEHPGDQEMDITIGGIRCFVLPDAYQKVANHTLDYDPAEGGFTLSNS